MSDLDDITLNSWVYSFLDQTPGRIVRAVKDFSSISTPPIEAPVTLEIAHSFGKGNAPNRHLVKLSANVTPDSATLNTPNYPISLHLVATVPKILAQADYEYYFTGAQSGLTNFMTDSMVDLISASDYSFMARLLSGGYK